MLPSVKNLLYILGVAGVCFFLVFVSWHLFSFYRGGLEASLVPVAVTNSVFDIIRIFDKATSQQNVVSQNGVLVIDVVVDDPTNIDLSLSKLEIFNLGGYKIGEAPIVPNFEPFLSVSWDTSGKAPGVYLARLQICLSGRCASQVRKFTIYPGQAPWFEDPDLSVARSTRPKRVDVSITLPELPDKSKCWLFSSYSMSFTVGVRKYSIKANQQSQTVSVPFPRDGIQWFKIRCIDPPKFITDSQPKFFIIGPRNYQPDNYVDVLFIPIGFLQTSDEINFFQEIVQRFSQTFIAKTPLRESPNPRIRVHLLQPKDCQEKPRSFWEGLLTVFQCAMRSSYRDTFDFVQGICLTERCGFAGGIGMISDLIPGVDISYGLPGIVYFPKSMWDSGEAMKTQISGMSIHEFGHNFGLYHIDGCGAIGTCLGPNAPDCDLPPEEKKLDIMDYCDPFERFGPAGYQFLRGSIFPNYIY